MAGWAYSNFGDDQQTAQDDQLRQVDARGTLLFVQREDEVNEFRAATATSPTGPSLTPSGAVPLKSTISREALAAKRKPAVPAWIKKRPAEQEPTASPAACSSSTGDAVDAAASKRSKPDGAGGGAVASPAAASAQPAAAASVPAPLAALVGYGDSDDDDDNDDDNEG
eukprot:6360412-Prymnesium_polylepis.1